MTNRPQIKIDNPCPMTLGRLKDGDNFSCKSCNQTLIDFRDKTADEIIQVISVRKTCGIFNENQVIVPKFSFTSRLIFKILTVLAIFGFNVKPLKAQTNQTPKDSSSVLNQKITLDKKTESKLNSNDTIHVKPRKKNWWQRKKKSKTRIISGLPY